MSALQQQAFRLAASELGMATAAWLFVQETAGVAGDHAVSDLRDEMGRTWPVLDAVCAGWLAGERMLAPSVDALLPALEGASRLVLVGQEAIWTDALLAALPSGVRVGLVQEGDPIANWSRLLSNHGGRIEPLSLQDFQTWAGPRSVLLTFVYGAGAGQVFVLPAWLRTAGPDVRLQFRSLVGWCVLGVPLEIYPRWLVAAERTTLTDLVPPA